MLRVIEIDIVVGDYKGVILFNSVVCITSSRPYLNISQHGQDVHKSTLEL